jgi:hypothetical protein
VFLELAKVGAMFPPSGEIHSVRSQPPTCLMQPCLCSSQEILAWLALRFYVQRGFSDLVSPFGLPDLLILLGRCFLVALRTLSVPRVFFDLFSLLLGMVLSLL